jgi:hypothetical protein
MAVRITIFSLMHQSGENAMIGIVIMHEETGT